jgi:hypothetical protein
MSSRVEQLAPTNQAQDLDAEPSGGDSQTGLALAPQTIVRVQRHESKYTMIASATLQDGRLSWEARGLLGYLLSLPPDWQVRVEHLQKQGDAGRDALRRMLRELQQFGYLHGFGMKERGEGGRVVTREITVYETPDLNPHFQPVKPAPEKPSPVRPAPGRPATGQPSPEKPSPYKERSEVRTESQRTEETKDTHTPRAARATAESAAAGVRVSKSRFSLKLRREYATAKGLGEGWLNLSGDGRYDDNELFVEWRSRRTPEAIEQALTAPAPKRRPYGSALMHIASIVSTGGPGSAAGPAIELLFESGEISEEDRARLLAHDWTPAGRQSGAPQPASSTA